MDSSRVTCVGALIRDDRNRVYVHRRSPSSRLLPGTWDVVSGQVEAGETPRQALAREIAEETGWRLRRIEAEVADWEWSHDGITRRLGARQVVAFTDARNARSRAVMGKLGMRYAGDVTYRGKPDVLYELDRG